MTRNFRFPLLRALRANRDDLTVSRKVICNARITSSFRVILVEEDTPPRLRERRCYDRLSNPRKNNRESYREIDYRLSARNVQQNLTFSIQFNDPWSKSPVRLSRRDLESNLRRNILAITVTRSFNHARNRGRENEREEMCTCRKQRDATKRKKREPKKKPRSLTDVSLQKNVTRRFRPKRRALGVFRRSSCGHSRRLTARLFHALKLSLFRRAHKYGGSKKKIVVSLGVLCCQYILTAIFRDFSTI